jgi:hypothetical protein
VDSSPVKQFKKEPILKVLWSNKQVNNSKDSGEEVLFYGKKGKNLAVFLLGIIIIEVRFRSVIQCVLMLE